MKTLEIKTAVKHITATSVTTFIILFTLSNQRCLAQDPCPNDGQVALSNEETLASQYQPYPSGTPPVLQRFRFVPPTPYGPTYPTVLMLPPDIFKLESADDGVPTERQATYDLQFAGFLVFQVDHRLAPPGRLGHQLTTDKGYAPEQTDDLEHQILAALADPQCNGSIYLVGGSAGGTLALWCALDPATGAVTGWDETARSHIKAVVSFSGPANSAIGLIPAPSPRARSRTSNMTLKITLTSRIRLGLSLLAIPIAISGR